MIQIFLYQIVVHYFEIFNRINFILKPCSNKCVWKILSILSKLVFDLLNTIISSLGQSKNIENASRWVAMIYADKEYILSIIRWRTALWCILEKGLENERIPALADLGLTVGIAVMNSMKNAYIQSCTSIQFCYTLPLINYVTRNGFYTKDIIYYIGLIW